jgi:hypothetical protein
LNGAPDPRLLIAAVPLSHDSNPLVVSIEPASFENLPLAPRTHFAVFALPQAIATARRRRPCRL